MGKLLRLLIIVFIYIFCFTLYPAHTRMKEVSKRAWETSVKTLPLPTFHRIFEAFCVLSDGTERRALPLLTIVGYFPTSRVGRDNLILYSLLCLLPNFMEFTTIAIALSHYATMANLVFIVIIYILYV